MMQLLPCPFCGGPAGEVGFEFITCVGADLGERCIGKDIQVDIEHAERWNIRDGKRQATDDGHMTTAEQKAQGARCGCLGTDDYCPCQNRPDNKMKALRAYGGK